jgi:hypothetical protein
MRANLRDRRLLGGIVGDDLDGAARFGQPETVCRLVLIEAHRLSTALLQLGVLLHLGLMRFVGHALGHRRVLRECRRRRACKDGRERDEAVNVCMHGVDAKPWSRLQSQDTIYAYP